MTLTKTQIEHLRRMFTAGTDTDPKEELPADMQWNERQYLDALAELCNLALRGYVGGIPLQLQPHADLIVMAGRLEETTPAHWTSGEKRALLGFVLQHIGYHLQHSQRISNSISTEKP